MKVKLLIDSLCEADPNDYLKSLGIVKHGKLPTPPPAPPAPPAPPQRPQRPPEEDYSSKLAFSGNILDEPEEPDLPDFEEMDGNDLLDAWEDTCLDGRRVRYHNLYELFNVLGYDDADEFFSDNEGAIDAIRDFITDWLEQSKQFGGDGSWWSRMVQAIKDAKH